MLVRLSCQNLVNISRMAIRSAHFSLARHYSVCQINLKHSLLPTYKMCSSSPGNRHIDETERLKLEHVERTQKNTRLGLAFILAGFSTFATYVVIRWGAPSKDANGDLIVDEFSNMSLVKQHFLRAWRECLTFVSFIKEPSREKLLPEKLKEPFYQPPITILIEPIGILVKPEWSYKNGWRFKKRPRVEELVEQIGFPNFELVFFTSEPGFVAAPIIDSLDTKRVRMYQLFRDATKYLKGDHVKDLSCLNRDLSKVIMIDWDPRANCLQPENTLLLPKWDGNINEDDLSDLASLLSAIARSNVTDVRQILQYYNGFDNPIEEFRRRTKLLADEEKRAFSGENDRSLTKKFARSFFGTG